MDMNHFFKWEQATRDTIDVKKIYVDMSDDLVAGVLLSQIVYWFLPSQNGKTKLRIVKDGVYWLAKGREDWWEECRIKPRQFDTAFKKLEEKKLVEKKTMKFNGDPTIHIRILWDTFLPTLQTELDKLSTDLRESEELKKEEVDYIEHIQKQLDTTGFNESVKTDYQAKTIDNTGSNESVKTVSQNGEFVYADFVKTLTENTTENTNNMDGRLGEGTSSQPFSTSLASPSNSELAWSLLKETCQQHNINKPQALEFYKVWQYSYSDAPVTIVLATIRELLQDKWIMKKGKWTEQEYKNLTGLFHHRMRVWREMMVVYEDVDGL